MAQLTPAELQEVNRFLDAGKPLPDKYRFLLFEDKREVEGSYPGIMGQFLGNRRNHPGVGDGLCRINYS